MARIKSKAQRRKFAELLVAGKIDKDVYERWKRGAGSPNFRSTCATSASGASARAGGVKQSVTANDTREDAMAKRYFVRAAEVPPYHPANHTGTTNRRLIGAETVGAKNVEVVLGVIERGEGAAPHAHPGIEQVCYLLEGTALAEIGGERCELQPGDSCYFPAGVMHKFTATSEQPVKVLVIYSPPYGEKLPE